MNILIRTVHRTSETTFERLANQFYGNPDQGVTIALYNKVASIEDIPIGSVIRIPVMQEFGIGIGKINYIFASPAKRDVYGTDIAVDQNGNIQADATGDFLVSGGVKNLNQAILMRLKENVDKRIRLTAYGIKNTIADTTAGSAYIMTSIQDTVVSDPRVKDIQAISFSGSKDNVNVSIEYSDINDSRSSLEGVV